MSGALQMKKKLFLVAAGEISPRQKKTVKRITALKAKVTNKPDVFKRPADSVTQILLPPQEAGYIKVGKYDMY